MTEVSKMSLSMVFRIDIACRYRGEASAFGSKGAWRFFGAALLTSVCDDI